MECAKCGVVPETIFRVDGFKGTEGYMCGICAMRCQKCGNIVIAENIRFVDGKNICTKCAY